MTTHVPRSLFVISAGQDELALAMSFLRGQTFAPGARLLLPDALYSRHGRTLPVPAERYASLADISLAIDRHRPALAFLFSAYRFDLDRTLPLTSLQALLDRLRSARCRVVTSDPFLGLAPMVTRDAVDGRLLAIDRAAPVRAAVRLLTRLQDSKASLVRVPALDDVTHLYPGAIPDGESRFKRRSFFNPTSTYAGTPAAEAPEDSSSGRSTESWLFVLSPDDLNAQRTLIGIPELKACLTGLLTGAVEAGARPALAAPASIVKPLARTLGNGVRWLPDCPFIELESQVIHAGYVFDWNVYSFFYLTRLARGRPVFAFDRGLLAHTIAPVREMARAFYFGEWEPPLLDQRRLSSPYVLSHLAQAQQQSARSCVERWHASPTPDAIVDEILSTP
jgi:hypothetical protein